MNMDFFLRESAKYKNNHSVSYRELEYGFYLFQMLKRGDPEKIETAYQDWLTVRLQREREAYKKKGIGEDRWPPELRNLPPGDLPYIDWRVHLGIESNEIKQESIPSILSKPQDAPQTTKEEISEGEPPQSKENVDRAWNPFETDGFGQVLGEPEEPKGLGNRRQ